MKSRLQHVKHWKILARESGYCAMTLARQCRVSLRQLERYFRMRFRVSPRSYLKKLALDEAKTYLRQGLSVKETASRTGYGAAEHFSRDFKRRFGVSPRDWT